MYVEFQQLPFKIFRFLSPLFRRHPYGLVEIAVKCRACIISAFLRDRGNRIIRLDQIFTRRPNPHYIDILQRLTPMYCVNTLRKCVSLR